MSARARIMEMYCALWQTLNCGRIHVRPTLLRTLASNAGPRTHLVLGHLTHETLKKGKTNAYALKNVLFTRNSNKIEVLDLDQLFGWIS